MHCPVLVIGPDIEQQLSAYDSWNEAGYPSFLTHGRWDGYEIGGRFSSCALKTKDGKFVTTCHSSELDEQFQLRFSAIVFHGCWHQDTMCDSRFEYTTEWLQHLEKLRDWLIYEDYELTVVDCHF